MLSNSMQIMSNIMPGDVISNWDAFGLLTHQLSRHEFTNNEETLDRERLVNALQSATTSRNFTCQQQEELVELACQGFESCVAVLPCGAGKSMTFLVPAIYDMLKTTIVIVPTISILLSHIGELSRCNIAYLFSSGDSTSVSSFVHNFETTSGRAAVIILTVEALKNSRITDCITKLSRTAALRNIILDEAHAYLCSMTYRTSMSSIRFLKRFHTPIILLSATLPDSLALMTLVYCGFPAGETVKRIIKCPNLDRITIEAEEIDLDKLYPTAAQRAMGLVQEGSYVQIMCLTRKCCREIKAALNDACPNEVLTADTDIAEAGQTLKKWETGALHILITTTTGSAGINNQFADAIVFAGGAYHAVDMVQSMGRIARRPGSKGKSIILHCSSLAESLRHGASGARYLIRLAKQLALDNVNEEQLGQALSMNGAWRDMIAHPCWKQYLLQAVNPCCSSSNQRDTVQTCLALGTTSMCGACKQYRADDETNLVSMDLRENDVNNTPPESEQYASVFSQTASHDLHQIKQAAKLYLLQLENSCVCNDTNCSGTQGCIKYHNCCLRCMSNQHQVRHCSEQWRFPQNTCCFRCGDPRTSTRHGDHMCPLQEKLKHIISQAYQRQLSNSCSFNSLQEYLTSLYTSDCEKLWRFLASTP